MSSFITNIKNKFPDIRGNLPKDGLTFALVALSTALIIYIVYHLYKISKKTDLKTVTLLKTARKINTSMIDTINKDVDMPLLYNGTEFSYSFWLYINEFTPTQSPKLILFNNTNTSLSGATPIFYLDPSYVKLYVLLKTNKVSTQNRRNLNDLHTLKDCDYLEMNVPYVPMNRWVNVTLVVDNQYAQLFFDGELRKVIDATENHMIANKGWTGDDKTGVSSTLPECQDENNICCFNNLLSSNLGTSLNTGKITGSSNEVVEGYLSQVRFFNYAITLDHAKVIYRAGPINQNILSNVGVPMYGIRNPFYDLSEVQDCDANAQKDE